MRKVVVIGGGPAGMMSAIISAQQNNKVILLEKNEKLGKKLFITGKGRCNLTNDSSVENVINNVVTNSKFLFSALNEFSPSKVLDFFEDVGLKLKTERGNRVFPQSDKSSDVIKCLEALLIKNGVDIRLNTTVTDLIVTDDKITAVKYNGGIINCDAVIVATGGVSYPKTGSTGDGYKFASKLGHNVITPKPALVGIQLKRTILSGNKELTLKNVTLSASADNKVLYKELGEVLLTDYGISGPLTLTCSSLINNRNLNDITFFIDFKPALSEEKLESRILRDFSQAKNSPIYLVLSKLIPSAIEYAVLTQAGINKQKKVSDITAVERKNLIKALKYLKIQPKSFRSIDEAIITSGGISVKNISPKTMESKLIKDLYFAGEVIDVDALTGGYNIQIALSTGYVAGKNA